MKTHILIVSRLRYTWNLKHIKSNPISLRTRYQVLVDEKLFYKIPLGGAGVSSKDSSS